MPLRKYQRKVTKRKTRRLNRVRFKPYRKLSSMIERKRVDHTISSNFGNDGLCYPISLTAQSLTSAGRQGLKISAKWINMMLTIQWRASATQETVCRMIVFIDKLSEGVRPSGTDILETVSIDGQWRSRNQGRRFQILLDKIFVNKNVTTSVSKMETKRFKIPINRNIYYLDSSSADTALAKNAVYYLLIGDVSTADTDTPIGSGTTRMYYEEL